LGVRTGAASPIMVNRAISTGEVGKPVLEPLRRWDPERIGPYAVLGRLGAGAMGRVYLGRSTAGRLVAVKTIKIELADEAGFRARFAHEVAAARRVSGVFTAAVVAADPEADMPWLATAYVPAPSLSKLVAECGPLPVPAARWLAAGCAEALESIHSAGLVHRDLKPSNVLVSPDGPRVIDFGVARATERIQLTVTRGRSARPLTWPPSRHGIPGRRQWRATCSPSARLWPSPPPGMLHTGERRSWTCW
jgi:serine/threonine protein kinase